MLSFLPVDVKEFLKNQKALPDQLKCVAFEYFKIFGAAFPKQLIISKNPAGGKQFALRIPIDVPAEIILFVKEHPTHFEQLVEEAKLLQVEISRNSENKLRMCFHNRILLVCSEFTD